MFNASVEYLESRLITKPYSDNSYYLSTSDNKSYLVQIPFELPYNWSIMSISQGNLFQSVNITPMNDKNKKFELYSVPNYEYDLPEILVGSEIGSTKQKVENDDVLLCKINPRINRVWIVKQITEYQTIASSEWIVFRNKKLYSPYIHLYFSSPLFRNLLLTNVSGVGGSLMRAQPDSVKKYPVFIPPYIEQKRIADKVSQLFSLLDSIAENVN